MFQRIFKPIGNKSFFLFGPRGSGKSTYLKAQWGQDFFEINLLLDKWERRYQREPDLLISDLKALKKQPKWVVIDEVQKIPKLLDIVHELLETAKYKFVLTGSSARKLKRFSSNLLAGRAFHYNLFPLTAKELGQEFNIGDVLRWGSLPSVFGTSEASKEEYLRSYTQTYLREEILQEQIVRNAVPFRSFLEIAGQENGNIINYSNIAKDVGVDTKTVISYFQVLEDTLMGFMLPAFTQSVRKSAGKSPKFYIFDLGIKRALANEQRSNLEPRTASYGRAFEHFLILECLRLNSYTRSDYQFYHYHTTAGGEIDLILKRGREVHVIEIKSTTKIDRLEVQKLERIAEGIKGTKLYYVSQDSVSSKVGGVNCLHWTQFLNEVFPVHQSANS